MAAVANDGRRESLHEIGTRLESLADCFRAAGIVIARVNAVLVDDGRRAQNSERIEQAHLMAFFRQPNRDVRAVNAGAGYGDRGAHDPFAAEARSAATNRP